MLGVCALLQPLVQSLLANACFSDRNDARFLDGDTEVSGVRVNGHGAGIALRVEDPGWRTRAWGLVRFRR
jgi:hypothetical protein